jgi:uncharacterized protein
MEFEWDDQKNKANIQKHGFPFTVAADVLSSRHYLKRSERANEDRWLAIGRFGMVLVSVVYTMRKERYRIISIRRARHDEEKEYRSLYE